MCKHGLLLWMAGVALGGFLLCSPVGGSAQTGPAAAAQQGPSLGETLRRSKELHFFYLHGIGALGPGDNDSAALRAAVCDYLKDCVVRGGERGATEYADQGAFRLNAPPPALKYLGQEVWRKDANGDSSEEWNAAAPFVVHYKLARRNQQPAIYVDEINWWPLVLALKCRQIVENDAEFVGPNKDSIKLCSHTQPDKDGRFISYHWIDQETANSLLKRPSQGALANRKLKNGILDWGLSDAVMALGPLQPYLLDGIRQLIIKSVAARDGDARPESEREYVIVSHSLGSYLIFAALDARSAVPTATIERSGDEFNEVLKHTSRVYFFANQLRLLELANLDQQPGKDLLLHLKDWADLRCSYLSSLPGASGECARPEIVAFSDPSDLLTWTVPKLPTVEVRNVAVRNATRWFGLFASPTKAHSGYAKQKSILELMLKSGTL